MKDSSFKYISIIGGGGGGIKASGNKTDKERKH